MIKRILNSFIVIGWLIAGASIAYAQQCELRVRGEFGSETSSVDRSAFNADATNQETKRKYPSIALEGYRSFGEIPNGTYTVHASSPGYKTSVATIQVKCAAADVRVIRWLPMSKGEASNLVDVPATPPKEMRLDRMTKLGSSDTGSAIPAQPMIRDTPDGKVISGGVLNGKAINLPKPEYPTAANSAGAAGAVSVVVLVDQNGRVERANAVSGHPLLREAAADAARSALFAPRVLDGVPVKVSGVITYNFVLK